MHSSRILNRFLCASLTSPSKVGRGVSPILRAGIFKDTRLFARRGLTTDPSGTPTPKESEAPASVENSDAPAGADSDVQHDMRESTVTFKTGKFVNNRLDTIVRTIETSNSELRGSITTLHNFLESSKKESRSDAQKAVFWGVTAVASIAGLAGFILYEVLKRDDEAQQRASRIVFPK